MLSNCGDISEQGSLPVLRGTSQVTGPGVTPRDLAGTHSTYLRLAHGEFKVLPCTCLCPIGPVSPSEDRRVLRP